MRFPYAIDALGRTATADEEVAVRQLVEQLLFTSPGERVMRPSLGTGALQLVFAPLGEHVAVATRQLVHSALQTWLGDLLLVDDVSAEADDNRLTVTVRYTRRRDQQQSTATFTRSVP